MFLKNFADVPDDYIMFHGTDTIFDKLQLTDKHVTCEYDRDKHRLNILEDGEISGYFYDSFHFTRGMIAALGDPRFHVVIKAGGAWNPPKQPVRIQYYIQRDALVGLYMAETVPPLIRCLQRVSAQTETVSYSIPHARTEDKTSLTDIADGRLYPYQIHNVAWILSTDAALLGRHVRLDYVIYRGPFFRIADGLRIYFGKDGTLIPEHLLETRSTDIRALWICDPVGMGKTACVVRALKIMAQGDIEGKCLLVLPNKVFLQWKDELKLAKLPFTQVVCKRGYKKLMGNGAKKGLYMTTTSFLSNDVHTNDARFFDIDWDLVCMDEAHEFTAPSQRKTYLTQCQSFNRIKTLRYWFVTATPFMYTLSGAAKALQWCVGGGEYACALPLNSNLPSDTSTVIDSLKERSMRRTSIKDISKWVSIPPYTLETIRVQPTPVESALYKAESESGRHATDRMVQICSHPLCSPFYENIAKSYEEISLDVLALRSRVHLQEYCPKLQKRIEELNAATGEIIGMCAEDTRYLEESDATICQHMDIVSSLESELRSCKFRANSLDKLCADIEDERCVICFEPMIDFKVPACTHPLCTLCCDKIMSTRRNKCPTCRRPLEGIQHVVKEPQTDPSKDRKNRLGSKTVALLDLLDDILSNKDSRVIVFSRWDKMLKLIRKALGNRRCVRLSGNVHQLGSSLSKFRVNPDYRIALLSADVCASGLNLTEADTVIMYDVFDNDVVAARASAQQAIGRAHRIGQKKNVRVIRLVMEGTIEEQLLAKIDEG